MKELLKRVTILETYTRHSKTCEDFNNLDTTQGIKDFCEDCGHEAFICQGDYVNEKTDWETRTKESDFCWDICLGKFEGTYEDK